MEKQASQKRGIIWIILMNNAFRHDKDRFDTLIINIDTRLFEIHMLITGFVMDLLEAFPEKKTEINLTIPFADKNSLTIFKIKEIHSERNEIVKIIMSDDKDTMVNWDDLDVSSQYLIAHSVHAVYVTGKLNKITGS